MKVLHLGEVDGAGAPVALHPQVTVVRGLDAGRRSWLVDALASLSSGTVGATGELDAHGIRFPLDDASLRLLGLDQPAAAGTAVVSAADLPGYDGRTAPAQAARTEVADRRRRLTDELSRHRAELGAAMEERVAAAADVQALRSGDGAAGEALANAEAGRAQLEAQRRAAAQERVAATAAHGQAVAARERAAQARERAHADVDVAHQRHQEAMGSATQAAAAVEEARSVASGDPSEQLVAARDALSRAEQNAADVDPDLDASPVNRRLAELEQRRAELAGLQEALGPTGSSPVAEALDDLLAADDKAPPVVAALALADTWRDLHQQIRALDAGVPPAELEAEARVAQARRSAAEADADFNQPVLTPEQIAKVEAARDAVLDAQDKTEGRFGGARAKKRLDDLRSEERRVLERLGFSTYADYMMSSSSRGVGSANRAILETAKDQLAAATAELAAVPGAADRARRRGELFQRRDAVAPRVAELLGREPTGPEAEDELRDLREPQAPDEAALAQLATLLADIGIGVGPAPHDREDIVLLARSYLAEQQAAETRRSEVAAAVDVLDAVIDRLRDARRRGDVDVPDLPDLPRLAHPVHVEADPDEQEQALSRRETGWAEVETARSERDALEVALARHREAADRVHALEAEAQRTADAVAESAAAVAAAEEARARADGPDLAGAEAAAAEAEAELAQAREREEELANEAGGSTSGAEVDKLVAAAEARLQRAEQAVAETAGAEQSTAAELASSDADQAAATEGLREADEAMVAVDRGELLEATVWELLSRLASVRAAGLAGSVPLVLDDPFTAIGDDEVPVLLDRVAPLAGAVQLVVVSDREAVAEWARVAGPERAAVVAA